MNLTKNWIDGTHLLVHCAVVERMRRTCFGVERLDETRVTNLQPHMWGTNEESNIQTLYCTTHVKLLIPIVFEIHSFQDKH